MHGAPCRRSRAGRCSSAGPLRTRSLAVAKHGSKVREVVGFTPHASPRLDLLCQVRHSCLITHISAHIHRMRALGCGAERLWGRKGGWRDEGAGHVGWCWDLGLHLPSHRGACACLSCVCARGG